MTSPHFEKLLSLAESWLDPIKKKTFDGVIQVILHYMPILSPLYPL